MVSAGYTYFFVEKGLWITMSEFIEFIKIEGLNLHSKRPRRSRSAAHRLERLDTPAIKRVWSMDFVQDALFNGSRFRILAVVDNYSKKCLSLLAGKSIKGEDVQHELTNIALCEGTVPERIQCDNGSEFISKKLDRWAYENKVTLDFSIPGKPTDNPYVESFNDKFRDECLSVNCSLVWMMPRRKSRTGNGNIITSGLPVL